MKKSILILGTAIFLIMGSLVVSSCNDSADSTNQKEKMEHHAEELYACPMHHNITGKKGDKCSECGMDLTSTKTAKEHQGHEHH